MKNKTRLLKNMNKEFADFYKQLEYSNESKDKYFTMSLLIDYVSKHYDDKDNKIVKELLKYPAPLKTLYDIFTSYVELDKVIGKVVNDFFVKNQKHRPAFDKCIYCNQFYEDDDCFCDEDEFDDEGLIHDNEDF